MNKYELISDGASVVTASYSIANLKETLSIIILVLSILNILVNMLIRTINHIKNKQYAKVNTEIETAKHELQEIEKNLNEKDR